MSITLAFDVYGTLLDPSGMAKYLTEDVGAEAVAFANLWRQKQFECSFLRGLLRAGATLSEDPINDRRTFNPAYQLERN